MTRRLRERMVYSVLLLAYPRDFRARFSAEMIDAFSEEMSVRREMCGMKGALRSWCSAVWEMFSVAGPLRLHEPIVIPLLLSFLASSAFALAFFAAVTPHCVK